MTRHRTDAEREAAQARFDAMVADETRRLRDDHAKAWAEMTPEERAERAEQAFRKYGDAA